MPKTAPTPEQLAELERLQAEYRSAKELAEEAFAALVKYQTENELANEGFDDEEAA